MGEGDCQLNELSRLHANIFSITEPQLFWFTSRCITINSHTRTQKVELANKSWPRPQPQPGSTSLLRAVTQLAKRTYIWFRTRDYRDGRAIVLVVVVEVVVVVAVEVDAFVVLFQHKSYRW